MLLGRPMQDFHARLVAWSVERPGRRYHYVTAWEMAQLVHAAERGARLEDVLSEPNSLTGTSSRTPMALQVP
jgi:hypothetical protein